MGLTNYDDPKFRVRRLLGNAPQTTGLSVPGTAASDTVLARFPVNEDITVSGSARIRHSTGGTAAGPTLLFCKSLAGTATCGTANAFGTYLVGTAADTTKGWCALTSTSFAAGDEIVLVNLAGTAAATPVLIYTFSYVESLE